MALILELFKTAIHDNNSLNSIDKFTYLKGLLGSSALATVEGFAITAENYAKAVEILKDRFGRKDAIINSHMQKLLSVTPLKRSDDTKDVLGIKDPLRKKTRIELEEAAKDHLQDMSQEMQMGDMLLVYLDSRSSISIKL
ncbi:DUF1758 domain-containing protein [Trichonephila clavipes]|nr:DUF1758 domain-containing protein [Trichonephila clavipes]